MKKTILVKTFLVAFLVAGAAERAFSEDTGAKLNSNDGSTRFIVQDKDAVTVFSADSDGNTVINGTATVAGSGFSVGGSTFVVKNGNVGIGTANLAGGKITVMDVRNLTNPEQPWMNSLLALYNNGITNNNLHSIVFTAANTGAGSNTVGAISSIVTDHTDLSMDGDLYFGTAKDSAFSTKMVIKNTGNVGIGTTGPGSLLHLYGASPVLRIQRNSAADQAEGIRFLDQVNGSGYFVGIETISENALVFRASSDTANERMRITQSGNVGIGTTGPGAILETSVNSSGNQLLLKQTDAYTGAGANVSSNRFYVYQDASGGAIAFGGTPTFNGSNIISALTKDYPGAARGTSAIESVDGSLRFHVNNAGTDTLNALYIKNNGNVGIGTTNPGYQLQLSLDSAAKPTSNTWTIASDRRVKKDIEPFTDGLEVVRRINPIRYKLNGKAGLPEGAEGISVVAQEAKEAIPYAISTYKARLDPSDAQETDIYNFNSSPLTFVLINAVKELKAENDALKSKIAEIEKKLK